MSAEPATSEHVTVVYFCLLILGLVFFILTDVELAKTGRCVTAQADRIAALTTRSPASARLIADADARIKKDCPHD